MADSPQDQNPGPERKPLDINSILLPKKEGGPSPLSAQRVNAGALLEQEQEAKQEMPEQKSGLPGVAKQDARTGDPRTFAQASPVEPPPVPKKEESSVRAVETYTTDINRVVRAAASRPSALPPPRPSAAPG
jgi:hypothetical protein